METASPGRTSTPSCVRTYSAKASALHWLRSSSSSRRLRNVGRSSRGMVITTCRCGTGSKTSCWSHSAHSSERFFSHEGHRFLVRQEYGTR